MKHKKENEKRGHVTADAGKQETDIRTALLTEKIPFVFESDKKLLEELASQNSYIRSLFRL
jgi:hypothetical protein